MCKVFSPFLLEIVVCDAQKHKYCIYKAGGKNVMRDVQSLFSFPLRNCGV